MARLRKTLLTIGLGLILVNGIGPSMAAAKVFRNSYVSFELPQKWKCKIEGTEWLCSSTYKQQSREAVIILTAKESGPTDNLAAYQAHLGKVQLKTSATKKATKSKVIHVKRRKIASQEWVDGMHEGSEIPNYYTRYLATVRDRIAILVTFSAHKKHYTKYSSDFFRAIQSLRVVASQSLTKNKPNVAPIGGSQEVFGGSVSDIPLGPDEDFPDEFDTDSETQASQWIALVFILLAAGAGYYFIKKRQNS